LGKLIALLGRGAAGNARDVANFTTAVMEIVRCRGFRSRFIALSAVLDHPLPTYTKGRLKSMLTDRTLSGSLVPMLASSELLRTADLIDRASDVIEQFFPLELKEEEYVAGIQRWELLPRSEDSKKISEHPAMLWKILNVRDHLKKQQRKGKERKEQQRVK